MNELEDRLAAAVSETASFAADNVADRVARRRRRRRITGVAAAGLVAIVGVSTLVVLLDDDAPDVESADPPPSTAPPGPVELVPAAENPRGADGVAGSGSDLHVETVDTLGFVECGTDGEPGPPTGARAAELEAVIDGLRAAGLHDQPFVDSSGGPQSIWGVPFVGLSARYEPTLRWLADRVGTADVCVELPELGLRNLPPTLAAVIVDRSASRDELVVAAEGCEPKGEWVQPFIRETAGRAETGIAIGRGQSSFTDDCPPPRSHTFTHAPGLEATVATEPGTLFFEGPVATGGTVAFTFDPRNAASTTTIGDDLIAQLATDPTVQFQVSDIFSGSPVAGAVDEVATDQWPISGEGTILVPPGVPAGTYHVRLIAHPELNGTLEVVEGSTGADWGWTVPDLDGDDEPDTVAGSTGHVYLDRPAGLAPLLDAGGGPISVPVSGDHVFTCNPDGRLFEQWDAPIDDEQFSRRLAELVVTDGVGEWVPSPSFVFPVGEARLPDRGEGCAPFGDQPPPAPDEEPVADGPISDLHVDATDLVFSDCESLPQTGEVDETRLTELSDRLVADGVTQQPFVNSVGGPGFGFVDALDIILQRRYQPTIDWLADRAAPDEICFLLLPPPGFFTQPADVHDWALVGTPAADDTSVTLDRAPGECISPGEQYPPIVRYHADRIEIALPVARVPAGPDYTICRRGRQQVVDLTEPVGDRAIVPLIGPTMAISGQLDARGTELDVPFTISFDPADLGDATIGDDVMLQSVDDPSIQVQISGVFTDSPTVGDPAPIVTDRWAPTGRATLIVPSGTPPGDYTFTFIEHPQLWGELTVR